MIDHRQASQEEPGAASRSDATVFPKISARQNSLIYLSPDATDPAVIRRVTSFQRCGFEVNSFSFRRVAHNRMYEPTWHNVSLGTIKDRAYFSRIGYLLRAVGILYRNRRRFATAKVVCARNLDLLFLSILGRRFARASTPIVYEVLDIAKPFTARSIRGRILRALERILCKQIQLLVTSSPAFITAYYKYKQGYTGESYVLENTIECGAGLPPRHVVCAKIEHRYNGRPWTIGWFGTLRCRQSLDILLQLAANVGDQVQIYMRGYPRLIGIETFRKAVSNHPNMIYDGEFKNPDDLTAMYARIDFNWCFDFQDPHGNSKWLLPNRLYDGGYFGVPGLAARNSQAGSKLTELGMGWTFEVPYADSIAEFLYTLSNDHYLAKRNQIREMPTEYFCDPKDVERLFERLGLEAN